MRPRRGCRLIMSVERLTPSRAALNDRLLVRESRLALAHAARDRHCAFDLIRFDSIRWSLRLLQCRRAAQLH